jgi:UDP-glucose 4-epimerase
MVGFGPVAGVAGPRDMARVLVTGGAGFIGSHLADALLARGHEVTVFDDLSGGFRSNVPAQADFVPGSVTDHALVDRLFAERAFDYVYHLAAYAAEGLSHFIKRFNYTNNVIGSANVINAAVNTGVKGFVFASSIAVYGSGPASKNGPAPMTEDMRPAPEDPYGIAKYAVEQELASTRSMFGLDYMIFRPHNVYGPRQNIGDRYRNVVGIFMNQILQGLPMTIFGDGTQTRAFSYIDDVAPVMASAIDTPGCWNEVLNVGADDPYTLNDLAVRVAAAMGVPARVEHLPARHEVLHAHSSHAKMARIFGARQATPLDDGLRAMAAWVKAQGARSSPSFDGIEITRNLPAAWAPR